MAYIISSGDLESGIILERNTMTVLDGGIATDTTVNSGGRVTVSSGGTATGTTVNSKGSMTVANGGTAEITTVNTGGKLEVSSGGAANDAALHGDMNIVRGGTATGVTVLESGAMTVFSRGTADSTTVNSGGILNVSGGTVTDTTVNSMGSMTVYSGTASQTTVNSFGVITVSSGGAVDTIIVNPGGSMYVSSGGKAVNVIENGGLVNFQQDASVTFVPHTITDLVVLKNASLNSGTTATGIVISGDPAKLYVGGGVANNALVSEGGQLLVYPGAVANDTTVASGGLLDVGYAPVAAGPNNDMVGAVANNTTVLAGGRVLLHFGTANSTSVGSRARMSVSRSCTANGITVNSGGMIDVESGGTVKGSIQLENGARMSMFEGAILDFDLTQAEAGAEALVNDLSIVQGTPTYTLTVDGSWKPGSYVYSLAEGVAKFTGTISVVNTAGDELGTLTVGKTVKIGYDDYALKLNEGALTVSIEVADPPPTNLVGTADMLMWLDQTGAYVVELSTDAFRHVLAVETSSKALELYELPRGSYQWRVKDLGGEDWAVGKEFVNKKVPGAAKVVQSEADGLDDLFFAAANGTWSQIYYARHVGSVGETWSGTGEFVSANGKGRIQNLFFGSADPNVLCLTDGENGDAIFLDDVYTELPETVEANTARLLQIHEIRAGAGDDIVDMTSQQFEYIGDGILIRGGDGNDVLWANKGNNTLFGDEGNDRLVGASGDDLIAGGIGDDRMHGGGGNDIFTFCEKWGADTVEQLARGSVTLWFASGELANWHADTLTYTDGDNSVTVKGVTAEQVTLKFGDDGSAQFTSLASAGAFDAFTSQRVFERNTAVVAIGEL